jgi:hypothetical protein
MNQNEFEAVCNRMNTALAHVAGELATLTDIAVSLGSITTELQELNRNLYDMDNSLSGIKTWIQNSVENN